MAAPSAVYSLSFSITPQLSSQQPSSFVSPSQHPHCTNEETEAGKERRMAAPQAHQAAGEQLLAAQAPGDLVCRPGPGQSSPWIVCPNTVKIRKSRPVPSVPP